MSSKRTCGGDDRSDRNEALRNLASADPVEGISDRREDRADILPDGIELGEMIENLGHSLLDLALAGAERLHARAELFLAARFDLIQRLDQVIAIGTRLAEHGLDTEYRRLQRDEVGLRPRQFIPELVQRHQ